MQNCKTSLFLLKGNGKTGRLGLGIRRKSPGSMEMDRGEEREDTDEYDFKDRTFM